MGLDFIGPDSIKVSYTRRPVILMAYICVFICSSTKAVHIEAVSGLTADAFLASLRRFIARSGKPQSISSDSGTNFVGAKIQLDELYNILGRSSSQDKIHNFCADPRTEWKFIPECSPHFGGLWEAAVKSTKTHLKRSICWSKHQENTNLFNKSHLTVSG